MKTTKFKLEFFVCRFEHLKFVLVSSFVLRVSDFAGTT